MRLTGLIGMFYASICKFNKTVCNRSKQSCRSYHKMRILSVYKYICPHNLTPPRKYSFSIYLPLLPPVNRNDINDRITPNVSTVSSVYTLPVFGSGRSSSRLLPREISTSWAFVPEKLPCTACVMAVDRCSVKLYRYMLQVFVDVVDLVQEV